MLATLPDSVQEAIRVHEAAGSYSAPAYQSLTPGAELSIIPGSAHLTTIDAPEAFVDTLLRFPQSKKNR